MKPAVEAIFGGTALVVFPMMAYLAIGLHYPVYSFMPPKWRPVVDLITVLAPIGAFQSIVAYNGALLISKGKAKIQFVASAINSGLFLATFLIALPFGLQRFVEFYAAVAAMNCIGFIWLMCWAGDLQILGLLRALTPAAVGTGAALAAVYAATRLQLYTLSQWLIGTAVFGIVVLAVYAAFRKTILAHAHALTATGVTPHAEADQSADSSAPILATASTSMSKSASMDR
jgi:O-antigen/teichoic acid export membrane protein